MQAAIGQSEFLFTPLQLANYVAAQANGGTLYQPYLVQSIRTYNDREVVEETQPVVRNTIDIKPENLKAVLDGMRLVTSSSEGTAAAYFANYPIDVAAKTGTSQLGRGTDNGVFVAYAPFDDPQIAICVVIEHAGHGSSCAPVARKMLDAYFRLDQGAQEGADNTPADPAGETNVLR